MRLSNFFKSPSYWAQNCLAIDTDGNQINLNEYSESAMRDRKIKSMSLHGALGYFFSFEKEPERRNQMMSKLRKAIEAVTGKRYYIAEFNNHPKTKFEDIVKVIKLAEKL